MTTHLASPYIGSAIQGAVKRIAVSVAALALAVFSACSDGPTGPRSNELLGTLHLPSGQAGVVLEFTPAHGIDSLRVGPATSSPNAYLVVLSETEGRALVLAQDGESLGTVVRMRLFLNSNGTKRAVTGRVLERSDMDGRVAEGAGSAQIVWER